MTNTLKTTVSLGALTGLLVHLRTPWRNWRTPYRCGR
jgi:hypothetical protein